MSRGHCQHIYIEMGLRCSLPIPYMIFQTDLLSFRHFLGLFFCTLFAKHSHCRWNLGISYPAVLTLTRSPAADCCLSCTIDGEVLNMLRIFVGDCLWHHCRKTKTGCIGYCIELLHWNKGKLYLMFNWTFWFVNYTLIFSIDIRIDRRAVYSENISTPTYHWNPVVIYKIEE